MGAALELDRVSRSYGDDGSGMPVLIEASLRVDPGEFAAIVGPSGCGKSTLLNIAGGLDRRYSGTVRVDGTDLGAMDDRALSAFRGRTIGFVFQSFNLLPGFSALENVLLPGFFTGGQSNARARGLEALEHVGLGAKAHKKPGELSGGERQRVALARALCSRPPLLLADEPTGNLDQRTGEQIVQLLSDLNREHGMTLVVVTHEARVSRVAGRVLHLADGKIGPSGEAATGAPAEAVP